MSCFVQYSSAFLACSVCFVMQHVDIASIKSVSDILDIAGAGQRLLNTALDTSVAMQSMRSLALLWFPPSLSL